MSVARGICPNAAGILLFFNNVILIRNRCYFENITKQLKFIFFHVLNLCLGLFFSGKYYMILHGLEKFCWRYLEEGK